MNTYRIKLRPFTFAFIFVVISTVPMPASDGFDTVKKLNALQVDQIKVGGEAGRRIDMILINNILQLDIDQQVLDYFRKRDNRDGYRGLGKLTDAFIMYSLYTGDMTVKKKKDYIIQTTIENQGAGGYIGMMDPESRMFGHATWDIHEMSYIIYALSQNYRYYHDKGSMNAAEKAASYIMDHWAEKPLDWQSKVNVAESVAFTGFEEALVNLYELTGDRKYYDFLLRERDFLNWDLDIVIGRKPLIEGHIYSFMSRLLAQLKLYAIQPSPELLQQTEKAFDFMTNQDGLTITGGTGQVEIWDDSQDGRDYLAETCATAYFMRVCSQLIQLTGNAYFGDLMERTLYNSLFGAMSPSCEHTRYFTPFEGQREYDPQPSYCCNNNLRRVMPALPEMAFYTAENSLAVNLYVEAEATVSLGDNSTLLIRQTTDYPSSGKIKIELLPENDLSFNLMLRIPSWCREATLSVNGTSMDATPSSGRFFVLNRLWSKGDVVELQLNMVPRLVSGVKKQSGQAAVMYGPQIYCLNSENAGKFSKLDGASLGHITLNPNSLKVVEDATVRPNGTAVLAEIWVPGDWRTLAVDLQQIRLTEFPDPNGHAIYFKLQDQGNSQPDELFHRSKRAFYPMSD